ncbi:MAG: type II secretion system F family protein, partial [Rhodoglobus sp.]
RDACDEFGVQIGDCEGVLELSRRAGVPAGELLRSEADEVRRAARFEAQEKAARLGVRLMLPLGLCILPAFMALGVVPLLITVVSSTVGSF